MNEKASTNLETAEKEAREAASKYREILDQAKDDGQKVKQQIIDQANEEARAKIEQAQKEIETEKPAIKISTTLIKDLYPQLNYIKYFVYIKGKK